MRQEEQACEGLLFWKGKNMRYDAFISYRRDNGFLMAQVIHDRLAEKGITSFLDLEELRSGKFNEKLYEAIDNSNNFILILSKGALDGCISSNDWVRKEILEAIEKKKTIIPILCDGFEWPKDKHREMPDELCTLENYNAVESTQAYLSAMIDRLISFMSNIEDKNINSESIQNFSDSITTEEYFGKALKDVKNIESIDMAFHGGAEWFTGIEKTDLLYDFVEAGVYIRILLNPPDVADKIAQYMRHKRKTYMSFKECIAKWRAFEKEYPDNVEIHIVDIPLLHRYYSLHMKNSKQDTINVKYYTYANSIPDKNYQSIFYRESDFFKLYRYEFDYLWNKKPEPLDSSTAAFICSALKKLGTVLEIDMLFRAGSEWHHKSELVDILLYAMKENITVRVIINDAKTVESLSIYMRQPLKKYYGYSQSCKDWMEKAQLYPNSIQVRIADIPMMHRYYCVKGEKSGTAKVSFYTYGNYAPEKDFQYIFDSERDEYKLYEEEFEYIWNKASHADIPEI